MFSCLCEPCCDGCTHGCCGCDCPCHRPYIAPPLKLADFDVKVILTKKVFSPTRERYRRLGELIGKVMVSRYEKWKRKQIAALFEEPASE